MNTPGLTGKAKRVRIYVSEGDLHGHQPIHAALLHGLVSFNESEK
jgi:PII-like signaling protein